jgi:hypothetical protein
MLTDENKLSRLEFCLNEQERMHDELEDTSPTGEVSARFQGTMIP